MKIMRSHWSVMYGGPHHGVFIKKIERLAGIKATELDCERFVWNDEKIEHSTFYVEHQASTWEEFVLEMLHTARLVFPVWNITIGAKSLEGLTSPHLSGPNVEYQQRISGHREIKWEINAFQQYQRMSWLNGQPNRW